MAATVTVAPELFPLGKEPGRPGHRIGPSELGRDDGDRPESFAGVQRRGSLARPVVLRQRASGADVVDTRRGHCSGAWHRQVPGPAADPGDQAPYRLFVPLFWAVRRALQAYLGDDPDGRRAGLTPGRAGPPLETGQRHAAPLCLVRGSRAAAAGSPSRARARARGRLWTRSRFRLWSRSRTRLWSWSRTRLWARPRAKPRFRTRSRTKPRSQSRAKPRPRAKPGPRIRATGSRSRAGVRPRGRSRAGAGAWSRAQSRAGAGPRA